MRHYAVILRSIAQADLLGSLINLVTLTRLVPSLLAPERRWRGFCASIMREKTFEETDREFHRTIVDDRSIIFTYHGWATFFGARVCAALLCEFMTSRWFSMTTFSAFSAALSVLTIALLIYSFVFRLSILKRRSHSRRKILIVQRVFLLLTLAYSVSVLYITPISSNYDHR